MQLKYKAKGQWLRAKGRFLKHKAKSQWLRAKSCFSRHSSAPQSDGKFTSSKAQFFPELKSTRRRGSWGPYGRSQSTGLLAFLGFPTQRAFIARRCLSGAAPVRTTLTIDENETKVKCYFA